jgi:hypothetical protein
MGNSMAKRFSVSLVTVSVLAACGGSGPAPHLHAVGTYIGGGSMSFGSDPCTYAGSAASVFGGDDKPATEAARGPRYVTGTGTITRECPETKMTFTAVMPTGVTISGSSAFKIGSTNNDHYRGILVANGTELDGEPRLDWTLGPDCAGIAEFGPVHGSQDTGGPAKTRSLVAKTKGTCTVMLTATTGDNVLYPTFKGSTFKAEKKVAIN